MIFGSVCSGIEAASVAWHWLGWRAAFVSEIEAFPRAVLKHHYPDVPLHGDFTTIREDEYAAIDVLVGGTPCQSFSVAGLRGGLADDRGNLALEFLRLAQRTRPRWVVWENVPGVLSSAGGRDFGAILGGLGELGYGWAYRVLDAQYVRVDGFRRAVPQRRRRVFVIGCTGGWQRAAAVLFERASLGGHPPPRREAGQGAAASLAASSGGCSGKDAIDGRVIPSTGDVSHCLNAGGMGRIDYETETVIAHALRADGFDASEDGTGRGTPLVQVPVALTLRAGGNATGGDRPYGTDVDTCDVLLPERVQGVALRGRDDGATAELTGDVMTALRCGGGGGDKPHVLAPMAFAENSRAEVRLMDGDGQIAPQLTTGGGKPGQGQPCIAFHARQDPDSGPVTHPLDTDGSSIGVLTGWRVRRLTPTECERLQGFPDGYTDVPYRGKAAADGPRYKALGNSMAVNVMRWIGRRIEMVEAVNQDQ
jgi:DNA (cytosine-5)-methyltransferase 1